MKLVRSVRSGVGGQMPAARAVSMHRISHAISRARLRIVCSPSRSCRTSAGQFPCTMLQYVEPTVSIREMPKYFPSASMLAVVPARRVEHPVADVYQIEQRPELPV